MRIGRFKGCSPNLECNSKGHRPLFVMLKGGFNIGRINRPFAGSSLFPLEKKKKPWQVCKTSKASYLSCRWSGWFPVGAKQAKGALSVGTLDAAILILQCRLTILKKWRKGLERTCTFSSGWMYFWKLSVSFKFGNDSVSTPSAYFAWGPYIIPTRWVEKQIDTSQFQNQGVWCSTAASQQGQTRWINL